jgi:hypothetical protein
MKSVWGAIRGLVVAAILILAGLEIWHLLVA